MRLQHRHFAVSSCLSLARSKPTEGRSGIFGQRMTRTAARTDLADTIGGAFANSELLERAEVQLAVEEVIDGLDLGQIRLAEKVDRRQISLPTAERRMREADSLVAAAERDRDAGKADAARRRLAAVDALLR